MTRLITLVGFALLLAAAVGLELVARSWGRGATLGEATSLAVRRLPVRVLLLAGWLWLGWHLFVRVDWR